MSRAPFDGGGVPGKDPRSQVEINCKLSPHTTFVVEVGGVIDDHYASRLPIHFRAPGTVTARFRFEC